jgi:hypothetical protein
MERHHVQWLIHGHTHRPAVHDLQANGQPAWRVVLGAWHSEGSMVKVTPDDVELIHFRSNSCASTIPKSPCLGEVCAFPAPHASLPQHHSQGTSMSRKKWSQPLIWGMIIAILNPLG